METIELGSRIEVTGKGLLGKVAYIGLPSFASGKWVGIILDTANGKNDGCVKGERYFTCDDNHGMFLRMSQLNAIGEGESPTPAVISEVRKTGIRMPASRLSLALICPNTPPGGIPKPSTPTETQTKVTKTSPKVANESINSTPKTTSVPVTVEPAPVKSLSSIGDNSSIDKLEADNLDLKQKFDTIMVKRMEDKNKLKSLQKSAIQLEQMMEYKQKSQEQTVILQKQLQDAKKEKKELMDNFNAYKDEMADISDSMEMITLDKMMAEEKAESYQIELINCKDKLEETTLDFQILKEEINTCDNTEGGIANNYKVKQLEQQKERLQEAIIKLRDASFEEKSEYQKLVKEHTSLKTDFTSIQKDKTRLLSDVENMEVQALEYTEQIDVAQGSIEMVEKLTDKILEHDEALRKIQEEKSDLEAICEVNDELQESVRETELELRNEVETTQNELLKMKSLYDNSRGDGKDLQSTIDKFRMQVVELQVRNDQLTNGMDVVQQTVPAPINQKEIIEKPISIRSVSQTLDFDLRTLERDHLSLYIECLKNFCPDSFQNKFGNYDSIGLTIIVPRMIAKTNFLYNQIIEQIDIPECLSRDQVLIGQKVKLFTFMKLFLYKLSSTVLVLNHFNFSIKKCSLESFASVIKVSDNIYSRENVIDCFIDLLRNNKLDDRMSTDSIYGLQSYIRNLEIENLSEQREEDARQSLLDNVFVSQSAFDSAIQNISYLKYMLNVGLDSSDASILLKDIDSNVNKARTFTRKVKKVVINPKEQFSFNETSTVSVLQQLQKQILLLVMCLNSTTTACLNKITIMTDGKVPTDKDNVGVTSANLLTQLTDSFKENQTSFTDDTDSRTLAESIANTWSSIWDSLDSGEFNSTTKPKVLSSAITLLADQVKVDFGSNEKIRKNLEKSLQENLKLKIMIKSQQDDINEKMLRMELAENRILATQTKTGQLLQAQKQFEDNANNSNNRQKECEEALDALQSDNAVLEAEKRDLKEQLKSAKANSAISVVSPTKGGDNSNNKQTETLVITLNSVIQENATLRGNRVYNQLKSLGSLKTPIVNKEIDILRRNTKIAVHEYYKCLAGSTVVDVSKRVPGVKPVSSAIDPLKQLLAMNYHQSELRSRASLLQSRLFSKLSELNENNHVKTKSVSFPTWQYNQVTIKMLYGHR